MVYFLPFFYTRADRKERRAENKILEAGAEHLRNCHIQTRPKDPDRCTPYRDVCNTNAQSVVNGKW